MFKVNDKYNMDYKTLITDILDKCLIEIKQDENMKKIKETVLNPFITYVLEQIYPYLIGSVVLFVLTFLVAIITLVIIIRGN